MDILPGTPCRIVVRGSTQVIIMIACLGSITSKIHPEVHALVWAWSDFYLSTHTDTSLLIQLTISSIQYITLLHVGHSGFWEGHFECNITCSKCILHYFIVVVSVRTIFYHKLLVILVYRERISASHFDAYVVLMICHMSFISFIWTNNIVSFKMLERISNLKVLHVCNSTFIT